MLGGYDRPLSVIVSSLGGFPDTIPIGCVLVLIEGASYCHRAPPHLYEGTWFASCTLSQLVSQIFRDFRAFLIPRAWDRDGAQ